MIMAAVVGEIYPEGRSTVRPREPWFVGSRGFGRTLAHTSTRNLP